MTFNPSCRACSGDTYLQAADVIHVSRGTMLSYGMPKLLTANKFHLSAAEYVTSYKMYELKVSAEWGISFNKDTPLWMIFQTMSVPGV